MIYGNRFYAFNQPVKEAVEEISVPEVEVSLELALAQEDPFFAERLDEIYEAELNSYYDNMVLNEGANTEYTDIFKKHFTEYKDSFKAGKKLYKDGKLTEAKKEFNKAVAAANDILKDIKKVTSDNLGSAICGYFIAVLVSSVNMALASLGPLAIVGYPGTVIASIHSIINLFKSLIKDKDKLSKGLNAYKNQLETAGKFLKQIAELAAKKCDDQKKVKESYEECQDVNALISANLNEYCLQEEANLDALVIQEGATSEYIDIAKKYKQVYKDEMNAGKAAKQKGRFADAKKHFMAAADACDKLEKNFKKVTSDNLGSVLSGFGWSFIWGIGASVVISLATYVTGGVFSILIDLVSLQQLIHWFKTFDTSNLAKTFNIYRDNVSYGFAIYKRLALDAAKKC